MNFELILQLLKARAVLIVFIVGITVLATGLFTFTQTKQYAASTSLVLTFKDSGPFEQLGVPSQQAASYMATQVDIIRNHNVALRVIDSLAIAEDRKSTTDFLAAHWGKTPEEFSYPVRDWLAEDLLENLNVSPSRESRVLKIEFMSASPEMAAGIADAFAQAYIDMTLQLSMEPARRNAAWFDSQLKTLQIRLEQQQQKLTDYQQEQGIVEIDERLDTETQRLEELSSNLTAAEAQSFDVRSRQLGVAHPEYIRAIDREQSLKRLLANQKTKVLEIKRQRDQLDLLLRDLDNTRSMYDAAIQRYYQTSLESQFNQTNIAVLNKSVVPDKPASPNVILNMALALFLGSVFALGITAVLEALNRRVRVEEDIKDELGIPVLAVI